MLELDEKLYELIKWIVDTYGISKKEAIASIINKVKNYELCGKRCSF